MREEFHSMLLPSRTAALEGVAAVRGQLQGRKQAAWPLNSSSVLSALAQTVPNRPQLVPDKFWCLFLCARCCRPCSQRLTFAWLVPVHVPSATLHGAVYHSVRKNSFESFRTELRLLPSAPFVVDRGVAGFPCGRAATTTSSSKTQRVVAHFLCRHADARVRLSV